MKRLLAGLTVPVLAASLLSGCSGGQETNADDTTSGSSGPASPSTPESPAGSPSDGSASVDPNAAGAGTKYCDLLSTDFANLFANIRGPEDVSAAVGVIKQIAAEAPPAVQDEWGVMEGALGQVKGALTKAAALQKQAAAGKVSKQKLQQESAKLIKDMQALNTPENNKAGDAVSKHATQYCGIKLG